MTEAHRCNNLPKVVTQRCLEQDLNPRPTDRKPNALPVASPRHHILRGKFCNYDLSKSPSTPILLCGLDACTVSSRQLRCLNYVVVSCARKFFNINSSETTAECIIMFGISDITETLAMRKDRYIKRFMSNSSAVCEICYAMSGHL